MTLDKQMKTVWLVEIVGSFKLPFERLDDSVLLKTNKKLQKSSVKIVYVERRVPAPHVG